MTSRPFSAATGRENVYLLEFAGEDDRLAFAEASAFAERVDSPAEGVGIATSLDLEQADRLALTRVISRHLVSIEGDLETVLAAVDGLEVEADATVAVRARDVRSRAGIDTAHVERRVGSALDERGSEIDLGSPDLELRVVASVSDGDVAWFMGWKVIEPPRGYGARAPPKRPFRQPGTMSPLLARVLVNLSGIRPGGTLFDPMCGPGGVLIEAALVGAAPLGMDVQRSMVRGARTNVAAFRPPDGVSATVLQGSASAIPIRSTDAVVFDAPYGRQSPIAFASARELVEATLGELRPITDRCVAVFDAPIGALAARTGWTVTDRFERRVHRSLTRHIAVLEVAGD